MANVVQQIHEAIKSLAATTLGADYNEMPRILVPEENDLRTGAKAYGVRHLSGSYADGVTRAYTMDLGFELILTDRIADRNSDANAQVVFNALHDKADAFLVQAFLTKVGLPTIVLVVNQPTFSEPQVMPNGLALLRVGFNVKYRQDIA